VSDIETSTLDLRALVGSRVDGIQEYAPEPLDVLARRLGLPVGQLIKLDANENPYGLPASAEEALRAYAHLSRYPDPICRQLRTAIAARTRVDATSIVVGNGSDELIDLILKLFRPGPSGGGVSQIINCPPTFGMYQFYGTANDMTVVSVPRKDDFSLDMDRIEQIIAQDPSPRILFACSPNNPDGQSLPDSDLHRLLELPLLVVLDEAYVDFGAASRVKLVAERSNLIVLRTFSKWAGLAGLRIGYGVFPSGLMSGLSRLKSPYNVNAAAQAAALAVMNDIDSAMANVAKIVTERARLIERLRQIPFLQVHDSEANFILCRVRGISIEALCAAMERRGIILRYFDREGLRDSIRISVGTPMQDEALLMVLRSFDVRRVS